MFYVLRLFVHFVAARAMFESMFECYFFHG